MAEVMINGRLTTKQEMAELLGLAIKAGKPNIVLMGFWSAFPWYKCEKQCQRFKKCVFGDCMNRADKLQGLRIMAGIKIRDTDGEHRKLVRGTFKTYRMVVKSGKPCFVCGESEANHRHHVLQIQNGGHNSPRNVVLLCDPCHRDVHKHA